MTLITFILHVAAMLLASLTLAHYLGKAGTERRPLFPLRPFNCRPCLTFWLAVLLWAGPAYLAALACAASGGATFPTALWGLVGLGVAASLALFFYEKSKYHIHE